MHGKASVFLLFAGIGLAVLAALVPFAQIRHIELAPGSALSLAEVKAICGIGEHPRWFSTDTEALALALRSDPRVASAQVRMRFPATLSIAVVDRVAAAVVYARSASGRMEAHCVDAHGVVFAPACAHKDRGALPVLSGLEIRALRYGMQLDGPFVTVLASMARLATTEPALAMAISELRVVSRSGAQAELLVYPAHYRLPVRMGTELDATLVKSFLLVLDVVESGNLGVSVSELDFRSDTYVLRTKEAVSG